jgi:PhnB protein
MEDAPAAEGERGTIGYPSIVPYLLVPDGRALIAFFERAFGAKQKFLAPTEQGVMHAEVEVGSGMLMISDAAETPRGPMHLCLYVADVDSVYHSSMNAGAVSVSAPEDKHYGDWVAGIADPAGNTWWICSRQR